MSNFYIQRAGKTIGPLTWDRVVGLVDSGKLTSTSPVSDNSQGPWIAFEEMQKRQQPAAELSTAALYVSDGLPAFGEVGNLPPPMNTPYLNASWQDPVQSPTRNSKRNSQERPIEGTENASFFIRVFLPWIGENSNARYGNLERYIEIIKLVNRVGFIISLIGLILTTTLYPIIGLIANFDEVNFLIIVVVFILSLVFFVLGLIVLHILYVVGMASCDLLRLLIDLESNTRNKR